MECSALNPDRKIFGELIWWDLEVLNDNSALLPPLPYDNPDELTEKFSGGLQFLNVRPLGFSQQFEAKQSIPVNIPENVVFGCRHCSRVKATNLAPILLHQVWKALPCCSIASCIRYLVLFCALLFTYCTVPALLCYSVYCSTAQWTVYLHRQELSVIDGRFCR